MRSKIYILVAGAALFGLLLASLAGPGCVRDANRAIDHLRRENELLQQQVISLQRAVRDNTVCLATTMASPVSPVQPVTQVKPVRPVNPPAATPASTVTATDIAIGTAAGAVAGEVALWGIRSLFR